MNISARSLDTTAFYFNYGLVHQRAVFLEAFEADVHPKPENCEH